MLPPEIIIAVVGLFGVCLGSFLNVLILRLPEEQKITGRSGCRHCHRELAWYDLVPVLSMLLLQGRCRYCAGPISWQYPIIELVTGILFAIIAWQVIPHDSLSVAIMLRMLVIAALCIAIFVIDLRHYLILDVLVYPGIVIVAALGAIIDMLGGIPLWSTQSYTGAGLLGVAAAFVPFFALWLFSRGRWMGFGDVKFTIFMGLSLGFPVIIIGLFLSFMSGAFISVFLLLFGYKQLSSRIPFGTFLTVATVISMLWGEILWHGYAQFAGLY